MKGAIIQRRRPIREVGALRLLMAVTLIWLVDPDPIPASQTRSDAKGDLGPAHQLDANWSQWRGAARNGMSFNSPELRDALPEDGLLPRWQTDATIPSGNQGGWSSPIVDEARVYLFVHAQRREGESRTYEETVYAWNRETGEAIWTYTRPGHRTRFPPSGTPTLNEGRLYYLGADRTAVCLDAASGDEIWQHRIAGPESSEPYHSSFIVVDGVAAVHLDKLVGLDAATGEPLWEIVAEGSRPAPPGPSHSSPVIWKSASGNRLICNTGRRQTICVDVRSGEAIWTLDSDAGFATPVISNDQLVTYGQSRRGGLAVYQLSDEAPRERWRNQSFADAGSSPLVTDERVYLQSGRQLICLRLSDGASLWEADLEMARPRYTSLIGANGVGLYGFDGVIVFSLESTRFDLHWNARIDQEGRLATADYFRRRLRTDEFGARLSDDEFRRRWRIEIEQAGPLPCCTPVLDDGQLIVRLRDRVVVYDLRR